MHLINRLMNNVFCAPEGAGTGAGASNTEPAAGTTPAAGAASSDAAAGATPPAAAAAANAAPPPAGAYRPDGLADNLYGKTDHETIDNLAKALKGYRDRDAKGGGVPDKAEGYLDVGAAVPDKAKGYFEALKDDPVFNKIAGIAKDAGVSKGQFGALLGAFLEGNAEAGMFDPLIDVAAERSALIPDAAKSLPKAEQDAAIDKRMNDNVAWLKAMEAQGLPKDAASYLQTMTFDTAKGHQFVEWVRGKLEGAGIHPVGGGTGGANQSLAALKQEMVTNAKYRVGSPDYDAAATRELQARILQMAST